MEPNISMYTYKIRTEELEAGRSLEIMYLRGYKTNINKNKEHKHNPVSKKTKHVNEHT